jgi:CBS domain-containing protein
VAVYADFDTSEPPFGLLEPGLRERAVRAMDIHFYSAGDEIIPPGVETHSLFVVDKGLVEEQDPGAESPETPVAHYRSGELFGSLALLRGRSRHRYVAREDTLCHALPKKVFLELVYGSAAFGEFFHQDLATKTKLVAQSGAYRDLVNFNMARVDESSMRSAIVVRADTAVREVVATMRDAGCDCVLVRDGDRYGMLTRTDMLEAVALEGLGVDTPVGPMATWSLLGIDRGGFLFEALIRMTRHGIERLVVMENELPAGLVEMTDILGFLSSHSHVLALRVDRARNFEELTSASAGIPDLARSLFAQKVGVRFIMDLLAELHRRILARNFGLIVPPHVLEESCLLVAGSEGRGEQVMRTDQNNALIIEPELDWRERDAHLALFADRTLELGYPPSAAGMMISNPAWVLDTSQWRERIDGWSRLESDTDVADLSAFLDATPLVGRAALFDPLRDRLNETLPRDRESLAAMALPAKAVGDPPPFYEAGDTEGRAIDVKHYGIFPIVHGARTLALAARLDSANTFRRLEALGESGELDPQLARDLGEAFSVLIELRLGQQLQRVDEQGNTAIPPDVANLVDTSRLAHGELTLLREALRTVRDFRQHLGARYALP